MSDIEDRVFRLFADTSKMHPDDGLLVAQTIAAVHGDDGAARARVRAVLIAYETGYDPWVINDLIAAVRGTR